MKCPHCRGTDCGSNYGEGWFHNQSKRCKGRCEQIEILKADLRERYQVAFDEMMYGTHECDEDCTHGSGGLLSPDPPDHG